MNKLKVAKYSFNAKTETDPTKLIFSSDYGTLKYDQKIATQLQINAAVSDIAARQVITHGLGYYPFAEVFVRVYIGSPANNYEYVPFFGSGASVQYGANFKLTTNDITLYAEINGVSSSLWNFDFLIFLYKNNLGL